MPETEKVVPVFPTNIPLTYCNGFTLTLSNADVNLILVWNNAPVSTVSMSFTTAKTLMNGLTELIGQLERASERDIMDISTVSAVLERMNAQAAESEKQP